MSLLEDYKKAIYDQILSKVVLNDWYNDVVKELHEITPIALTPCDINKKWIIRSLSGYCLNGDYGFIIQTPASKTGIRASYDAYQAKLGPYLKNRV